ncbi:unnamed protein product [Mortierella alpina]
MLQFTDPANTVYYVDGYPALEKQVTHRMCDEKRVKAVTTAETAIKIVEERVSQARPPTKELCKESEKAYESVKTLWRPVGKKDDIKTLEYNKAAVLQKYSLTRNKLTALACVSCNEYNKNIRYQGIATNYKVLKDLPDGDVPSLVLMYHGSPLVIWRDLSNVDFTASILVFTMMTQGIAAAEAAASDPPSTAPLIDQAALPSHSRSSISFVEALPNLDASIMLC